MMKHRLFSTTEELDNQFYDYFVELLTASSEETRGIMLSGGSTPLPIYQRLAKSDVKANTKVMLMYSDDRHLPPSSKHSNFGNTLPMIQALGIEEDRIIRVCGDKALDEAARDYAQRLDEFFGNGGMLEVAIVGLGTDGHTCSLFNLEAAARRDVSAFHVVAEAGFNRVTVSRSVLMRSKKIIFLVSGMKKRDMLRQLVDDPNSIPAGVAVAGHPDVEIWTDVNFTGD
jgi:6-phosphogluconolactonase